LSVLTKAKRAGKIQFAATLASKGIGVIFTIVLARILFPEDYGNLTVAILVTGFLTIFSNFGFQTFIIQNDDPDARIVHTTFFLELAFAALVVCLLFGTSFVSDFYFNNETVGMMLRLYCINIFIVAAGHTPLTLFKKDLDFATSSKVEIAYTLISNFFRVAFALAGFGSLSFPLGDIAGSLCKTLMIYYYSPFRPRFSMLSKEWTPRILKFGGYTSVTSIASYLANQTDKILLTSLFELRAVGLYNFGYAQSGLFYNLVLVSQTSVFQSMFARLKQNLEEARRAVYRITRFINFIALPVYAFAILDAHRIITVLFTEKWIASEPYFQIFAFDFLVRTFFASVTGIQLSFGLSQQAAKTKVVTSSMFIGCLLLASLFHDPYYYAFAYLAGTVLSSLIN
jgi:O-antigen/teichoic acid export membrane protein